MNLVFLQRLDQAGGGSRASLRGTLRALRNEQPDWKLTLVSEQCGPVGQEVREWGVAHQVAAMSRFRKPWERLSFWRDCRRLADSLAGLTPHGILSNEWVTAPHALKVARHLGVPAMSYVRDFAAVARGKKYHLHRMDRLLCVCETMRQELIAVGYDPEKVRTVYNPVLQPISAEPEAEALAQINGAVNVDRWLFYLGRVSPRKNQIAAVETLKLLREQSGQRWGLILAGDADEDYAATVKQAARAAGLADQVIRVGLIPKPGWLFELADASILTSKSEGLARVLIESFLCDTPAFSYPLDGLADVYDDEMTTFVADHRDPATLVHTILSSLSEEGRLRERTAKLKQMLATRHSVKNHVASFRRAVTFD